MRISDWSSDVCSSDLRSSHGGARLTIRYYETDRLAVDRVDDVDGADVRLLAEHMKEAVRHDTRPTTLSHMRAAPEKRVADDRRMHGEAEPAGEAGADSSIPERKHVGTGITGAVR